MTSKPNSDDILDPWVIVEHLHSATLTDVRKYLISHLYQISDNEIDFFLPQLCTLLITRDAAMSHDLEAFLLYKCMESIYFAIKCFWNLHAIQYYATKEQQQKRAEELRSNLEMVVVNGKLSSHAMMNIPDMIRDKISAKHNSHEEDLEALRLAARDLRKQKRDRKKLKKPRKKYTKKGKTVTKNNSNSLSSNTNVAEQGSKPTEQKKNTPIMIVITTITTLIITINATSITRKK